MTPLGIIKLLEKNNVDMYDAVVATSCFSAWECLDEEVQKKTSFTEFCKECSALWLDWQDDSGLTKIADMVGSYLTDYGTYPEDESDLY